MESHRDHGFSMAVGAYLYRINMTLATTLHCILAGTFQWGSIAYGFESVKIENSMESARQGIAITACCAAGICMITAGMAIKKTYVLENHLKIQKFLANSDTEYPAPQDQLTPQEV